MRTKARIYCIEKLKINEQFTRMLSHKHLHSIDFKHARISQLSDFVAIQQLHSSRTFVEVVAERDAAVPSIGFHPSASIV